METSSQTGGASAGGPATLLNKSSASNYIESDHFTHRTNLYYARSNWGKTGRSLSLNATYTLDWENSQKKELSQLFYANQSADQTKDLYYKNKTNGGSLYASLTYVEPVGKNWRLSTSITSNLKVSNVVSDAYNYTGAQHSFINSFADKNMYTSYDDYYSSVSEYRYLRNSANLLAQYSKGKTTVQFGGYGEVVNNENYSKTYGFSQTTGKGEYIWNWSPYARISLEDKKGMRYSLFYSGSSRNLSNSQISPVPDISNPSYIRFGNIYLQPEFSHALNAFATYNNKKNFSYFSMSLTFSRVSNNIVNANWFDSNGVQYNVPVNSPKGATDGNLYVGIYNLPLNKKRSITCHFNANMRYTRNFSYQNVAYSSSLDMDNFDYSKFMSDFWGNESGDLFYSGNSGFKQSRTNVVSYGADARIYYKDDIFNCSIGGGVMNYIMDYSLNDEADINTWDYNISAKFQVDTKNKYSITTTADYKLYSGYDKGYGKPEFLWNFEASKSIRSITISFKINDILNQTTSFRHITSANYVEDSYRGIIGRRFLVGITFNFGKMNSAKSRAASRSALNMLL